MVVIIVCINYTITLPFPSVGSLPAKLVTIGGIILVPHLLLLASFRNVATGAV